MKTTITEVTDTLKIMTAGKSRVKISTIRTGPDGKYTSYRLAWKVGKQGFRRAYNDSAKAMSEAERILKGLVSADGSVSAARGEDVIYFRECQKKLGKTPLHEAVDFFIKYHGYTVGVSKKFKEVFEEYLKSRQDAGKALSKLHTGTLKSRGKALTLAFGEMAVHTINEKIIVDWFSGEGNKFSITTKNNLLKTLAAILAYAKKKNYVGQSELATSGIFLGEKKKETPGIFTPDELKTILATADKETIPFITIMAFGGSRRAVMEKSTVDQIDLVDGQLRIPPEIAKTNSGRALDIPENLKAWLTLFAKDKGNIIPTARKSCLIPVKAKENGVVWKANGLRHSFCSYHLALHRNAALTSEIAGNSPQMLRDHYKALVSSAAAVEWFSITPEKVREYAKEK